jgi:hypothetical protein
LIFGQTAFAIKAIEDDIKKLYQCSFQLINNEPKNDELDKYNVIGIIKVLDVNSVPIKFIMINPDDESDKFELSKVEFKEKYPQIYSNLIDAVSQFEQQND